MLSYLHGFHAGNFADVHKHFTLCCMLEALTRKEKPFCYLETHSGRALYDFDDPQALKNREFEQGIARLWSLDVTADDAAVYLQTVAAFNRVALRSYPGSPCIAQHFAREADKLLLMELHPTEAAALKRQFRADKRVAVHNRDGYEGVLSLLPPKPNRGMVLIDPSYEEKNEYDQVITFLQKATKHWSNGSFAIWYPLLEANRWKTMKNKLKRSGIRNVLCSEIEVNHSDNGGMYGSGMLLVNPPWPLEQRLKEVMPGLTKRLKQEASECRLDWLVPE
ncbi:MAG: 23S rRNA (adenine(2030)-N(6))-methyltransferase RlmJ [Amphritea sp.]